MTIFSRMIQHWIKVLVRNNISSALLHDDHWLLSQKQAPKLTDWLVLKNGCADLIDRSAISSTQQEVLGL